MIAPASSRAIRHGFETADASSSRGELSTLVELLRWRAIEQPDEKAYIFLTEGEEEAEHVTYGELDRRARAIAVELGRRGATSERALLLYPPGLEFIAAFFGCLYAGVVAVPANPPQSNKQSPRLQAIISDSQAKLILISKPVLSRIERRLGETPALEALDRLITEEIDLGLASEWRETAISGDSLAYLQYTSGSTSTPKGVMVSHENVLHNMACLDQVFYHPPGSAIVTWLPHFHDMGLIYGTLEPIFKGIPCYMMPPASLIQQPIRWLRAISRYKATHSVGPNFAYDHCIRKIRPEQLLDLDLSRWGVAINGAEPVRKTTLERFIAKFASCGFRRDVFCPGYGLAEASLMVTGTPAEEAPVYCSVQSSALQRNRIVEVSEGESEAQTFVSSGYPALGTRVVIVDPESSIECPANRVGEVWVSGKSVTQGYWNRPEETERVFRAYLAGTNEGPFLRTGDLGFLKDGRLYITGRIKDLIIIAGRNHYPQDIEETVQSSHPAIRPDCCAAFSVDIEDEERLVIAAEIDSHYRANSSGAVTRLGHSETSRDDYATLELKLGGRQFLNPKDVIRTVRQAVATRHEVTPHAVLLLKAGTIPKTSSGKIQRHACGAGYKAGTLVLWEEPANSRKN